jgi:hypothetical protein
MASHAAEEARLAYPEARPEAGILLIPMDAHTTQTLPKVFTPLVTALRLSPRSLVTFCDLRVP